MWPFVLLTSYCLLVMASSLLGGVLPALLRITHTRMQLTMSFVGGLMLGVAVVHLLPHSILMMRDGNAFRLDSSMFWMLVGLLLMFLLIRFFHVHQHGQGEQLHGPRHMHGAHRAPAQPHADHSRHDHDHDHDHTEHSHEHGPERHVLPPGRAKLTWMAMALGLTLHTLFDGIALGSAVAVDFATSPRTWLAGLSAFTAIVLHKPLDALALTAVMTASGSQRGLQLAVNLGYACMCPIGVVLVYGLRETLPIDEQQMIVGAALAFSAGVFICIALADVLPEVSFHSHDRLALTVALILGVMVAYVIGLLEQPHTMSVGSGAGG